MGFGHPWTDLNCLHGETLGLLVPGAFGYACGNITISGAFPLLSQLLVDAKPP
jgi:hypothetical protein